MEKPRQLYSGLQLLPHHSFLPQNLSFFCSSSLSVHFFKIHEVEFRLSVLDFCYWDLYLYPKTEENIRLNVCILRPTVCSPVSPLYVYPPQAVNQADHLHLCPGVVTLGVVQQGGPQPPALPGRRSPLCHHGESGTPPLLGPLRPKPQSDCHS